MSKWFVVSPGGRKYTNLENSPGRALNVAVFKFTGTPNRSSGMPPKYKQKKWHDEMKPRGFKLIEVFKQ